MKNTAIEKQLLIRWIAIGVLAFLAVLFWFLNVSFDSKEEEEIPFTPGLETEEDLESPIYDIDLDNPVMDEMEEMSLKDRVWLSIMNQDLDYAIAELDKAYESNNLLESDELLAWYSDVSLLGVIPSIPTAHQAEALSSFESPRFQAVFPVFTSALTLSEIIDDPESLIPTDVQKFQLMSETWLTPEECPTVSPYLTSRLTYFESVYQASILYDEELIQAYVGIFPTGDVTLIGYYAEESEYQLDSFWEENREALSQMPTYNN